MDFYVVQSKIVRDRFGEEIYTKENDEDLFKEELCLAIIDSCGFNKQQAEIIYKESYSDGYSFGISAVASYAKYNSEMIREIINMEDKK